MLHTALAQVTPATTTHFAFSCNVYQNAVSQQQQSANFEFSLILQNWGLSSGSPVYF
jgi:hypothetical protein